MSTMVLTQVYLEPIQKKALSGQAKKTGRSVSDLMRDAVDAALAGVTTDELKTLDQGTRKAQEDIQSMLTELKANTGEHNDFLRQMAKLQKAAAQADAMP